MGQLWDIIQAHIDHSPYPPSERQVATRLGVAPNALSNWKNLRRLPQPENLLRISSLTGTPYRVVLNAALHDAGYLEEETTNEPPTTNASGKTSKSRAGTSVVPPSVEGTAARRGPRTRRIEGHEPSKTNTSGTRGTGRRKSDGPRPS